MGHFASSFKFFGSFPFASMPKRVREAIQERVQKNEILVRLVQLVLVSFIAILYSITPKTTPDNTQSTVPIVLGIYIVGGLIGLAWALKRRPPDWAIHISIFFDFALLYVLIVSFHLQYQQPSSFILKSPTLFYVFIFIALNALRFEVKFVLSAGLMASVGWLLIVVYVTMADPNDTMITKSYVEYLTSNSVLIGAEIDKVISILMVTILLAISVRTTSSLLVGLVTEADAAKEFSRFFDDSVARNIRFSDVSLVAGSAKKVQAAILNVDLRNFTRLARDKDPEHVMQVLTAYQARILPIIKANDGIIDKFMGDGIMASFGIEGAEADYAAKAIKTCEDILQDWRGWNEVEPLLANMEIGLGAAVGTVAFGAIGKDDRLEMTVIGTPVNLSARLEKLNKKNGSVCTVSKRIWDEAIKQGYVGSLECSLDGQPIDGMDKPVAVAILNLPDAALKSTSDNQQIYAPIPV